MQRTLLDPKSFIEILNNKEKVMFMFDYDGTLAELQDDHDTAYIREDRASLINKLTEIENTKVAIVTGRAMSGLKSLISGRLNDEILLYGSHGAEIGEESSESEHFDKLLEIRNEFENEDHVVFEDKPISLTLHYKTHPNREEVIAKLDKIATRYEDIFRVQQGHDVYEFLPREIHKGLAVKHLDNNHPGYFPLFLGDDLTDNFAFKVINQLNGLAIQVGDRIKDSVAGYQINKVDDTFDLVQAYIDSKLN